MYLQYLASSIQHACCNRSAGCVWLRRLAAVVFVFHFHCKIGKNDEKKIKAEKTKDLSVSVSQSCMQQMQQQCQQCQATSCTTLFRCGHAAKYCLIYLSTNIYLYSFFLIVVSTVYYDLNFVCYLLNSTEFVF